MKKIILYLLVTLAASETQAQWTVQGSLAHTSKDVGINTNNPANVLGLLHISPKNPASNQYKTYLPPTLATTGTNVGKEGLFFNAYYSNDDQRRVADIGVSGSKNNLAGGSVLRFLTNDISSQIVERMRIDRNGNVGIGTLSLSPSQKLQIDMGNILIRGVNNFAVNNSASNTWGGDEAIVFLGDENHYIKSKRGKGVLIRTYSDIPIFASSEVQYANGIYIQEGTLNVGICTDLTQNNANYKLSVNGGIRAKSIRIETGWADFVFDKTYKLPTLEYVESYINKNGHLPEIPSAAEVSENGIDVGSINAKLLQKIEELTLYVIQLRKEVDELQHK